MTDTTSNERQDPQPFTARVDPTVSERVKRAAYWTPGLSVGAFVTDALLVAVDEAEKANGGPFPPIPPGKSVTRKPG